MGLLEVDAGRVQYDEVVFSDLDRKEREVVRRRIGMLFQGGALFDSMTVLEYVEFPLRMFSDMTAEERRERIQRIRAEAAKAAGVESVVFDRNGYLYHGRVKSLADAAREGGLQF